MFCIHGLFHIIVTIMAHPLKNLKNFVEKIGIKHITITRYCPSFEWCCRKSCSDIQKCHDNIFSNKKHQYTLFWILLSRFLFSYRNTPHAQTRKTPSGILFNRKANRLNMINLNLDSKYTGRK